MDNGRRSTQQSLSRRDFLRVAGSAAAAGAGVVLLGACSDDSDGGTASTSGTDDDAPPETTRLRLPAVPSICVAPQYLAEEFLRAEGFTDIQYIKYAGTAASMPSVASAETDIALGFAAPVASVIDAGDPIRVLAGAHVGCFELFGTDRIQSVSDLVGKTVAVTEVASSAGDYAFIVSMLTNVGIDPTSDVNFEAHPRDEAIQLLAEGKVDAVLALPPTGQVLREKNIGHAVVVSHHDPPWSQYFCCLVAVNSGFYASHPVATKRALRAILKGADVCAREPERAARFIVDKGYTENYDHALATMKMLPYDVWREYDPEDTLRFYALRLNEARIVKGTPDEIIRRGTDWRLLEELKRELAL